LLTNKYLDGEIISEFNDHGQKVINVQTEVKIHHPILHLVCLRLGEFRGLPRSHGFSQSDTITGAFEIF